MRVLHVSKLYHPWIGGIEIAVQGLAEAMTEKVEVQVLACVPKGRGRSRDHNGVPVTLASSLGMFMGMPLSPTLPFLLARMSRWANVVHLHFPFPIGALAWLMLGSRRAKLVIHYHSDLVRQRGFLTLYRWLARAILLRSDAIIVTSPGLRDHSRILTGLTDRCVVIPLFARELPSRDVVQGHIETLQSRLQLQPNTRVALFVGRLAYYKGLDFLIEAMAGIEGRLLIVGDGPLERGLRDLVTMLALEDQVSFLGKLSDEDLVACYSVADVFVLPSVEQTEAFGLVQLEAMSFGVSVVNTDILTGVPWVSADRETGITVPPRDPEALRGALKTLFADSALRARLGQAGTTRAREFGKDRVIAQILDLYGGVKNR